MHLRCLGVLTLETDGKISNQFLSGVRTIVPFFSFVSMSGIASALKYFTNQSFTTLNKDSVLGLVFLAYALSHKAGVFPECLVCIFLCTLRVQFFLPCLDSPLQFTLLTCRLKTEIRRSCESILSFNIPSIDMRESSLISKSALVTEDLRERCVFLS